ASRELARELSISAQRHRRRPERAAEPALPTCVADLLDPGAVLRALAISDGCALAKRRSGRNRARLCAGLLGVALLDRAVELGGLARANVVLARMRCATICPSWPIISAMRWPTRRRRCGWSRPSTASIASTRSNFRTFWPGGWAGIMKWRAR